jgi:DNA-binding transcriptional LysR family regulator
MSLTALDLNLLVALDALLRLGSVTDAARELHLSQPAMSRTLQRLRDVLHDPLFVRVGRGVVPTERARALTVAVSDALDAARRVFAPPPTFDPATARGEFVLGLGDEAQVAFADAILAAVWAAAPGIDIRIRRLTEASLDEGRRGTIDLAIGPDLAALPATAGAVDYSDFVAKRLYTRRFVIASRAPGPFDLDTFCAARHVIVSFEGGGRGFVDDLLAMIGRSRRVAASVTSFPSAASLIVSSDLLGALPEEVAYTCAPGLHVSAPPFDVPELPMLLLWHPRQNADPRHQFLRERVAASVVARVAGWQMPAV